MLDALVLCWKLRIWRAESNQAAFTVVKRQTAVGI